MRTITQPTGRHRSGNFNYIVGYRVDLVYQHDSVVPNFHSQTNGDRFGFHQPSHLVPPGTEPDLQSLNNPYIAEKRAKECQLAAAHIQRSNSAGSGVVHQPQLPYARRPSSITATTASTVDRPLSDFKRNLDPSLRGPVVSGKTRRSNEDDGDEAELVGDYEEGHGNGYDGDQTDNSDDDSDDDLAQHRQQTPAG